MEKIVKAAEGAKKDGYEFIHSVVKSEGGKPLYNVLSVDIIIKLGKWLPAKLQQIPDTENQWGVKVWDKLPPKSISKPDALRRYGK